MILLFIRVVFILILIILMSDKAVADQVSINIDFQITNIAKAKDVPQFEGMRITPTPYKKINDYYNDLINRIKIGRRIKIEYRVINYQPSDKLISKIYGKKFAYRLFEIKWFRDALDANFLGKDGKWKQMIFYPIKEVLPLIASPAIINGYGNAPVLIAPQFSIYLKSKRSIHDIERVMKDENYKVITTKETIARGLYLVLNDEKLKKQKLVFSGSAELGASAITTERSPYWYPFDECSLEIIYKSFYDSIVKLNFKDIEDLELTPQKHMGFTAKPNQEDNLKIILHRKDKFKKFILPIALLFIPLIYYLLHAKFQREALKWQIRCFTYVLTSFLIYFYLPNPMHVPKVNLLSLSTVVVFILIVLTFEFYWKKKSRKKFHKNLLSNIEQK